MSKYNLKKVLEEFLYAGAYAEREANISGFSLLEKSNKEENNNGESNETITNQEISQVDINAVELKKSLIGASYIECLLTEYFKKDIKIKQDGDMAYVYSDKLDPILLLHADVFNEDVQSDFVLNLLKGLIARSIFKKELSEGETWSYLDESSESVTMSEQIEYNQSLRKLLKNMDVDIIFVSEKLRPLFETFRGYDKNYANYLQKTSQIYNSDSDTYEEIPLDENIEIEFVDFTENENVIIGQKFNSNSEKEFNNEKIKLLTSLLGEIPKIANNFKYVEIINLDNGIFGIENKLVRVENCREIVLYVNPKADNEYITKLMSFHKIFSGIEHITLNNPKTKYSYKPWFLADIKNKKD